MLRIIAPALLTGCALAACSPTFNWREVRAEPTALKAMLPCKPDKGARNVPMAGREVSLQVIGCDTGDAAGILHLQAIRRAVVITDFSGVENLVAVCDDGLKRSFWHGAMKAKRGETARRENDAQNLSVAGVPDVRQNYRSWLMPESVHCAPAVSNRGG